MQQPHTSEDDSASRRISDIIDGLADWRGDVLRKIRQLIREADPDIVEEVKWAKPTNPAGVPVWSHRGIVCTGEPYRSKIKLTFAKGASIQDPSELFNSSLDGNVRRAIDLRENDVLDENAFKRLIQAAISLNTGTPTREADGASHP